MQTGSIWWWLLFFLFWLKYACSCAGWDFRMQVISDKVKTVFLDSHTYTLAVCTPSLLFLIFFPYLLSPQKNLCQISIWDMGLAQNRNQLLYIWIPDCIIMRFYCFYTYPKSQCFPIRKTVPTVYTWRYKLVFW